jgi:hypothetical protein
MTTAIVGGLVTFFGVAILLFQIEIYKELKKSRVKPVE